ncbi:MAG TPA: hypothetical protein VFS07_08915 [Gemmatimonadales bacterium]|nr:hypothetical protein [Gemmatimonadales bacterium]HVX89100.1 hypothetical protein [Gemmatimonadales bacterium]
MQVVLAALADYALIDQAGRLSVVGIFSHVWVRRFPAMHPRTHLVVRLVGKRTEIGEHKLRIRFLDPAGTEILGGEGTFTVGEPPAGVTDVEAGVILAYDLPLPSAGRYRVELSLDGESVTTLPLSASEVSGG